MYKIILIDNLNRNLVSNFLKNAGNSLKTFRYFEKRTFDILNNHIVTCVLMQNDGTIVGYGHLDKEGDNIWLGIAVSENNLGKGLGKIIINFLINFAIKNKLKAIKLTVDNSNKQAICLYEKVGFIAVSIQNEYSIIMKKTIYA